MATGNAGLLVRKRVLDVIGYPWFETGRTARDEKGEDLWFSEKVHRAGFAIHVDCDLTLGHMTGMTVEPDRGPDGVWRIVIDADGARIAVPAARPIHLAQPSAAALAVADQGGRP